MVARKMVLETRVRGQQRFNALTLRFREGEHELEKQLVAALREDGRDTLLAVRQAWMGVVVRPPAKRPQIRRGRASLRRRVSTATKTAALRSGISIRVHEREVDPRYGRVLVLGLNNQLRWRHPLFGNRKRWYGQQGEEVFYATMRARHPIWQQRVDNTLDRFTRELER